MLLKMNWSEGVLYEAVRPVEISLL